MRPDISMFSGARLSRLVGVIATIAAAGLLAACASTGGGSAGGSSGGSGGFFGLFGGNNPNAGVTTVQSNKYDPNFFLKSDYCPPVQILPGTEAMIVYERGHDGDAAYIRTQGSITKTARECQVLDGNTLAVKVGIAGRILAGPAGGAGKVTMPIRIAVTRQHDNSVLFSKAYSINAMLSAPEFSADYSEVFDQVVAKLGPNDRDLIIFVGFDEGKPKGKAGT